MASKAQMARVEAMNAARARKRAEREGAEAETVAEAARAKVTPAKKVVGRSAKAAETAIARARRQRAEADAGDAADAGDDSPRSTIARAKAKVKKSPTVRRTAVSRDPVSGRVAVMGRHGKMVTRRVTNSEDKFFIGQEDIPEGWSYQWIALTVDGEEQRRTVANFVMGGWEPVGMDRYPGRYGPSHDSKNKLNTEHIIVDGLGLYERPEELTKEAREEEIAAAKNLIRTSNDQFVPRLPEARSQRLRGTGLQARRSIEPMPQDVNRPAYEVDVDPNLN